MLNLLEVRSVKLALEKRNSVLHLDVTGSDKRFNLVDLVVDVHFGCTTEDRDGTSWKRAHLLRQLFIVKKKLMRTSAGLSAFVQAIVTLFAALAAGPQS